MLNRSWSWLSLSLLTLGLVASWSLACQAADAHAEEKPENEAQADAADDTKFIRIHRTDKGDPVSLDTAVVRYIPQAADAPGLAVFLVGAVHVGEKSYYDQLNKLFDTYDVVLYELVAPEGTRIPKGAKADGGHPVALLQGGMKDLLELEHQLEQVDYTKDHFVHADMSPEQFAQSMKDRGESFLGMFFRAIGQSAAQQTKTKGTSDADLLIALFSKNRSVKLKRAMAAQFENLETAMNAFSGPDGSTIIEERNKVALQALSREIENGKKKIAIFYGAGHLPDMHARLQNEFKLKPAGVDWLPAWNLK